MKCPKCGLLMEEGTMHTQKYPFWTQQELRFTRDPFPEFPHAMLCRACGLVTFLCNLIEKSKKDPE